MQHIYWFKESFWQGSSFNLIGKTGSLWCMRGNEWLVCLLPAGSTTNWTTKIRVKYISKKGVTSSGVPQGSVLGPLFFLVYISYICNSSDQLKFYLFSDDTNLSYVEKFLRALEIKVNADLSKIYDWLSANSYL